MASDRDAIRILEQVRAVLQSRLVERVVESGAELLDDAAGDSYVGAIEAAHDQLGVKLAQVNLLLGVLAGTDTPTAVGPTDVSLTPGESNLSGPRNAVGDAAPSGVLDERPAEVAAGAAAPSWLQFVLQVQADSRLDAARSLVALFGLRPAEAAACAERFRDRHSVDADLADRVLRLPQLARADDSEAGLELLSEAFGLDGTAGRRVWHRLRGPCATGWSP